MNAKLNTKTTPKPAPVTMGTQPSAVSPEAPAALPSIKTLSDKELRGLVAVIRDELSTRRTAGRTEVGTKAIVKDPKSKFFNKAVTVVRGGKAWVTVQAEPFGPTVNVRRERLEVG